MRLNRGTLILLLASLVVIAVVLVLSNNQASAPGTETTTTPSAFSTAETVGPLFTGLDQANVASIEITDNKAGTSTVLTKSGTDIWTISSASYSANRETDQAAAAKAVTDLVGLQANDSFESDKLSDFGLDNPAYVITITNADGTQNIMYVGNKNPAGNRSYILIVTQPGTEVTPSVDSTSEATSETTVEAVTEATDEATTEATAEATTEVAIETTAEATAEPYQGMTPGVTSGTVYLVLQSSVNAITDLIATPPYVPAPTATATPPATLNPLSEVEQATQTAEFFASVTAIFDQLAMTETAQATSEATTEATPELTETPASN